MAKPRLATTSLAGCFGCHMSVLDIDERLLALVELVDFGKSPINDFKKFDARCAIGIVEGGCANEHDVEVLQDFRANCDVLVALGDCATMGGVPAMRNNVPLQECLEEAYLHSVTTYNPAGRIPSSPEIPLMLDRVYNCAEVVQMDYYLTGCPPSADTIWEAVAALLEGRDVQLPYALIKYD